MRLLLWERASRRQVMVNANGNGPKFASLVRKRITAALPNGLGAAIAKVGTLRKIAPTTERTKEDAMVGYSLPAAYRSVLIRFSMISKLCETWSLEELC